LLESLSHRPRRDGAKPVSVPFLHGDGFRYAAAGGWQAVPLPYQAQADCLDRPVRSLVHYSTNEPINWFLDRMGETVA